MGQHINLLVQRERNHPRVAVAIEDTKHRRRRVNLSLSPTPNSESSQPWYSFSIFFSLLFNVYIFFMVSWKILRMPFCYLVPVTLFVASGEREEDDYYDLCVKRGFKGGRITSYRSTNWWLGFEPSQANKTKQPPLSPSVLSTRPRFS